MSLYEPSFEIDFWFKTTMNYDEEESGCFYSFLSCPLVPLDMEFGEEIYENEEEYYEEGLEDNSPDLTHQWVNVIKQLEINKEYKIEKIKNKHLKEYYQ